MEEDDEITIIHFISNYFIQILLFILVFVIIGVVEHINYVNTMVLTNTIIPGGVAMVLKKQKTKKRNR